MNIENKSTPPSANRTLLVILVAVSSVIVLLLIIAVVDGFHKTQDTIIEASDQISTTSSSDSVQKTTLE